MRRPIPLILGLLALSALSAGCSRDQRHRATVAGSTSVQPFAEILAQDYNESQACYRVEVQGGGSTAGIRAVLDGIAAIGMVSRSLEARELSSLRPHTIALDGVAIIVNTRNPVADLALEQVRGIFAGRITNWKEVGGPDLRVQLVTREEGSGTREAFVHLVMSDAAIAGSALTQSSNGVVKETVKGDPGAIGYMSLGQVGEEVKALAIGGVSPSSGTVTSGAYPVVRPFVFVTRPEPDAAAQEFIRYVLSEKGQRLLEEHGLVAAPAAAPPAAPETSQAAP